MKVREGIALVIHRMRWVLLALLVPLVVLSSLGAGMLTIDNSVNVWFVEDDPALVAYDAFMDEFGNDEVVVLAVTHPQGVLGGDGLARLRAVHHAVEGIEGVAEVSSILNKDHVRIDETWVPNDWEAPPIEVAPVVDDESSPERLQERIAGDRTISGKLATADGKTGLVLARMEPGIDARRDSIMIELENAVEAVAPGTPNAGMGVVFSALNRASSFDVAVVGTVSYLIIFGLLFALYRRVGPVLVTIGIVAASAAATMGLMGWFGRNLNMVTMALPTLVLIIGVADSVHMLQHVAARRERDRTEKTVRGIGDVLWPCLFTSLTTAAGFAALGTAKMQVVRDLGWFAAAGVMIAFCISVVVVVVAMQWSWLEPRRTSASWLRSRLIRLGDFSIRHRQAVLAGCVVAVLGGAWGISRLVVDTYSIDYFYPQHTVRQHSDAIEATFGPYTPLELVVVGDDLRTSEALTAIAQWQDRIEQDPQVGWTASAADVTRRLNQVLSDGSDASYSAPPDDFALEQALLVYYSDSDADLSDLVIEQGDEWKKLRVTVGIDMMSAKDFGAVIERLEAQADFPDGMTIVPSGYIPLYVTMMDYIVASQITSFAAAFVAIFTLLALLFRSFRMALFSMPGNLLPIFVTLGVMGIAGIRLDVATVTIAALILGLVVDDTTHFLYRFREALHECGDHEAAVRTTLRTSGVAMTTTTLVLVLGFMILGMATVKSVAFFGLLAAVGLATALLGDLMVLPALLVTLKPKL